MEQEQGETYMVDIKKDMIKFSTDKELSKNEFRAWEDYVIKYNEDNPKDQICYELTWNKDEYKVKLLNLKVDREN
jgi:hypothetical protein